MSTDESYEELNAKLAKAIEGGRKYRDMMQAAENLYNAYHKYGSRNERTLEKMDKLVKRWDDMLG